MDCSQFWLELVGKVFNFGHFGEKLVNENAVKSAFETNEIF